MVELTPAVVVFEILASEVDFLTFSKETLNYNVGVFILRTFCILRKISKSENCKLSTWNAIYRARNIFVVIELNLTNILSFCKLKTVK